MAWLNLTYCRIVVTLIRVKQIYILAGANGSGKSTVARVLLPNENMAFVNPDDIARELAPDDFQRVRIKAGREALRRIGEFVSSGVSFALETTLSGSTYVNMIKRARALGYVVTLAYVYVDSPDVCIERIRARVENGGHFIPDEDVRRRYGRSKANFVNVYAPLADFWILYYNGGSDIVMVAHGNGEMTVISKERHDAFMEDVCRT